MSAEWRTVWPVRRAHFTSLKPKKYLQGVLWTDRHYISAFDKAFWFLVAGFSILPKAFSIEFFLPVVDQRKRFNSLSGYSKGFIVPETVINSQALALTTIIDCLLFLVPITSRRE